MRFLLLIILICFSSFQARNAAGSWVIERNSTLAIDGSSNINQFTCDIREYVKSDTLKSVIDQARKKYFFSNSVLSVDLKRFDCHHKYITADFRKMLKTEEYPNLVIRFISLDEFHEQGIVKGLVDIELAGKKKRMEINYNCSHIGSNQLRLQGEKLMKFSDFELEAPRKIGGLIRINEEINVHFNLYFRKLNS
ncbi:MAG TPA: hypothetical protein VK166_07995 [Chitinophagaceae bacterium]|nr:hypothetical protein [Chitinophagaceae bacterium]